jgi:gamma-glutamyltranspeptidase/glutathione hydrolase
MMTPAIVSLGDGSRIALGSGGSNRIRSAILQVLANVFEYGFDLEKAVVAPRLHLEHNHLSIEKGFSASARTALEAEWPGVEQWPEGNLFFGGVHAVRRFADGKFSAAGDPRRGGAVAMAHRGSL